MMAYSRPATGLRALVVALALTFLALAACATWYFAITELSSPKTITTQGHPTAVAWGNRVFTDERHFAAWLRARGISYKVWAARHGRAAHIVDPRRSKSVASHRASSDLPSTLEKGKAAQAAASSSSRQASGPSDVAAASNNIVRRILMLAIVALLLLVVSASMLPAAAWRRLCGRVPRLDQRVLMVGAVVAVCVGLLTATLLP